MICSVGLFLSQSGCSVKNGMRSGRTGKEETSQKLLQHPRQETVWSDPGWEGRQGHTGRSSLGCILELTGLPHGLETEQEAYRETTDDASKISGVNNQLGALTDMVWQANSSQNAYTVISGSCD